MPIRIEDPFRDPTFNLSEVVNPFVTLLKQGAEKGLLPVIYGSALKPMRSQWLEHFATKMTLKPKKLVLEIGSHRGDVLVAMAQKHSETAFLGMDITFKRVVGLAQKAKEQSLSNVISMMCNGKALSKLFAPNELDGIIVFFPDPWANKKRQHKNRLLNREMLESLQSVIKPGGFFWFKTDHEEYFRDIESLGNEIFPDIYQQDDITSEIYTSKFEKQFRDQGLPTFELCWRC